MQILYADDPVGANRTIANSTGKLIAGFVGLDTRIPAVKRMTGGRAARYEFACGTACCSALITDYRAGSSPVP
jgi:hypothetical protein